MKAVVLVSGFDSIVLLEYLKREDKDRELIPVYFKFGLPNQERELLQLPEGTKIVDVPDRLQFHGLDFTNGNIPDLKGRTTLMHVIACQLFRPDAVFSGVLPSDGYDESSVHCQHSLSATLTYMSGKNVGVVFPWLWKNFSKDKVLELAISYGMDYGSLVSCNDATDCGICRKCIDRMLAEIRTGGEVDDEKKLAFLLTTGALSGSEICEVCGYFGASTPGEALVKVGL